MTGRQLNLPEPEQLIEPMKPTEKEKIEPTLIFLNNIPEEVKKQRDKIIAKIKKKIEAKEFPTWTIIIFPGKKDINVLKERMESEMKNYHEAKKWFLAYFIEEPTLEWFRVSATNSAQYDIIVDNIKYEINPYKFEKKLVDNRDQEKAIVKAATTRIQNVLGWPYKNNGEPYFEEIPPKNAKEAAEKFWEWCESLTKFLEICFEHGIKTSASCAGHPEEYRFESYVDFDISDERTKELVEFVVENKLAEEMRIRKIKYGSKEICVLSMGVVVGKRDSLYEACTKQIEEIIKKHDVWEDKTKEEVTDNSNKSLIRRLIEIVESCNINDDGNINDDADKWYAIDFNVQNGLIVTTPKMDKYMFENWFSQIE